MTPAENKRLKELEKESKLRLMELLIWTEKALGAALQEKREALFEKQRTQSELHTVRAELHRERDIVSALTRIANR